MTRAEILSRYRHLRQISKEQHEAVLDITAADVLLDWARRIDLILQPEFSVDLGMRRCRG